MLDETYWVGKLRQYAHVVDKGLHRGDFTKGHGIPAYKLAKSALTHIKSSKFRQDPSVVWAIRKIKQYEDFQSSKLTGLNSEYVKTTCKYDELLNAIKTRRCIRHYLNKPVDEETINKITDVLDWSPSSCNLQPSRVYATNNPDIVKQCVKLHPGASCFTDIYAPLFLTFCADSRMYGMPNEVFAPFIDVALGVQNCILAAHTIGISLTPLSWALHTDWQECELRKLFKIPQHFQIIISAVGGYPVMGAEVPARKIKELFMVM